MGAVVELVRPDLTVAATVMTDEKGRYAIDLIVPGKYSLKAMARDFLPTMRENLRLRSAMVVDLTLNTLYEAINWLPARSAGDAAALDDWKWTLRSSASRPLLRWLEDGPLVVSEETSGARHLKARLVASGQTGTFGEDGETIRAEVEETPSASRELLARVEFEPGSDGEMESMLGFRQDLGLAGNVESMAAVTMHPEVEAPDGAGMRSAMMETREELTLGDLLNASFGSKQVFAASGGGQSIFKALPFATVSFHRGDSSIVYRVATEVPSEQMNAASMPQLTVRNGQLALEHGLHQELGWERLTKQTGMSVLVYTDSIRNPNLEASANIAPGSPIAGMVLYDPQSGLLHVAGADYSTTGLYASYERKLAGHNSVRLSYANGDALVLEQNASPVSAFLPQTHARHTQMYSLSLSGTIEGTGTRWRATYRWQPESTLTAVAPYQIESTSPYLNMGVRQRLHTAQGASGYRPVSPVSVDLLFDMRNLLAQGYHSWIAPDGTLMIYAENQRSVRAGLAFNF
jgi:hypothetical protein